MLNLEQLKDMVKDSHMTIRQVDSNTIAVDLKGKNPIYILEFKKGGKPVLRIFEYVPTVEFTDKFVYIKTSEIGVYQMHLAENVFMDRMTAEETFIKKLREIKNKLIMEIKDINTDLINHTGVEEPYWY